MTHFTEQAGFPGIALQAGMQLKLEAVSPTTNAAVTGVTCTRWMIYGDPMGALAAELTEHIPYYTPEQLEELNN